MGWVSDAPAGLRAHLGCSLGHRLRGAPTLLRRQRCVDPRQQQHDRRRRKRTRSGRSCARHSPRRHRLTFPGQRCVVAHLPGFSSEARWSHRRPRYRDARPERGKRVRRRRHLSPRAGSGNSDNRRTHGHRWPLETRHMQVRYRRHTSARRPRFSHAAHQARRDCAPREGLQCALRRRGQHGLSDPALMDRTDGEHHDETMAGTSCMRPGGFEPPTRGLEVQASGLGGSRLTWRNGWDKRFFGARRCRRLG